MKEKAEYDIFFSNKPELLLHALYYFATRFLFTKEPIECMLTDLEEMLNEVMRKQLPGRIAKKFEAFKELISIIATSIAGFYSSVTSH